MSARPHFLLFVLGFVSSTSCYKILVYNSKFSHSHSNFLGTIADVLVDAGHNVTSLIPIMDTALSDGTTKSHVIYVQPDPVVADFYASPRVLNVMEMNNWNPIASIMLGRILSNNFGRTCSRVLAGPGLIDKLKEEKYDVYVTENFDVCGIGIAKAIDAKAVIGSSSTCLLGWQFAEFGVEQALSYRPTLITSNLDVHSFTSRLWNLFGEFLHRYTFSSPRTTVNKLLKERFGSEYPSIAEQSAGTAYVFTNSEPLIESAAPTSSRVIDISGIGTKITKPLDKYWENVLTRREKTILLSFGTIAKANLIADAKKTGILKAISQFPDITFIWKYDEPDDDFCVNKTSKLGNVVMTKWMPQADILKHKNVALFITHGGMGSLLELARNAVPGIFIPIFGDQPRNAGMMQFNGLGVVYDKFELHDGEKLAATIKEVLENKKYRQNVRRLSRMLAKKPFTSRELLIKHVEFAAEFGASSALRPQSVDMSFVAYYNLDIIIVLGFFSVCTLGLLMHCVLQLVNYVGSQKKKIE